MNSIHDWFVRLNNTRGSSRLTFNDGKLKVHSSWRTIFWFKYFKDACSGNQATIQALTKTLNEWSLFQTSSERDAIYRDLEKLNGKKRHRLTAHHVRTIYKRVVTSHWQGFERIACTQDNVFKRVIVQKSNGHTTVKVQNAHFWALRKKMKDENRDTWNAYISHLNECWGKKRVHRTLKNYGYSLSRIKKLGQPLTVEDIKKITLGLADVHEKDVMISYKIVKDAIAMTSNKGAKKILELPLHEQQSLFRLLGVRDADSAIKELHKRYSKDVELPDDFHKLSLDDARFFISISALTVDEIEKMFLGERVEGLTIGYWSIISKFYFLFSKYMEDKKRLQGSQEAMQLHQKIDSDSLDNAYAELWTKMLVKHEFSNNNKISKGMMVPGVNGAWYTVHDEIKQNGKVAYFLKSASCDPKQPAFMVQRSTSASPSASNALNTLLQDLHPFTYPGYWKEMTGVNEEIAFMDEGTQPLIMTGHSLGGAFHQISLVHRIRKNPKLPNREITLILFDTTAIKKKDTDFFAKWAKENPEEAKKIKIKYFFSKGDPIPSGGSRHLGYGTEGTNVQVEFQKIDVDSNGDLPPELEINPHGRFYFRHRALQNRLVIKKKNIGSQKRLEQYDNKWSRLKMELFRRGVGLILFPPLRTLKVMQTVFYGCREEEAELISIVKNVVNTALSLTRRSTF